jgi:hypothetical protein
MEITSSASKRRIYINIGKGYEWIFAKDLTKDDVLIYTHISWVYTYDKTIADAFPGIKIIAEPASLDLGDFRITSVPAQYGNQMPLSGKGGNHIVSVESNGIKITHTGEMGQEKFYDFQMDAIRGTDLLFSMIYNPYDDGSVNKNRMDLISQAAPVYLVPTAYDVPRLKKALLIWPGEYIENKKAVFSFTRSDLTKGPTRILLLTKNASGLEMMYGVKKK